MEVRVIDEADGIDPEKFYQPSSDYIHVYVSFYKTNLEFHKCYVREEYDEVKALKDALKFFNADCDKHVIRKLKDYVFYIKSSSIPKWEKAYHEWMNSYYPPYWFNEYMNWKNSLNYVFGNNLGMINDESSYTRELFLREYFKE